MQAGVRIAIGMGLLAVAASGCGRAARDERAQGAPKPVGVLDRLAARHTSQKPAEQANVSSESHVVDSAADAASQTGIVAFAETELPEAGEPIEAGVERRTRIRVQTTLGDIVMELWPQSAPKTVANFLGYVDDGHYNGTIVHQIVPGRMVLAGGFTAELEEKAVGPPIENESHPARSNRRGTVAMARPFDRIHGATCQFFINLADNPKLDHRSQMAEEYGYCVFGEVVEGLEVIDRIGQAATKNTLRFELLPVDPIVIERVERVASEAEMTPAHVAQRPVGRENVPPRRAR